MLRERLEVLRRDVRTVANDLLGRRPPPFELRTPLNRHGGALVTPRTVEIARVVRETRDAVTLHLVDVSGARIEFVPGQFLTLLVDVGGETLRRAYSISCGSDRDGPGVAVTVKRVAGGRVSPRLVDAARVGDRLRVLGPSGSFGFAPDPTRERNVLLVGGGSGITPLASIARSVLAHEPASRVALVYGNRSIDDVIFRDALVPSARFVVRHVLEQPPRGWTGGVGRLDRATLDRELDALGPLHDVEVFVCGPSPMMAAAREALSSRGVVAVREERFSSPGQRSVRPGAPQPITLRRRGIERTIVARTEQTLLEAGLEAGIPLPFSCSLGGCGACKLRLVAGEVASDEPNCLRDDERARGLVLACVARATRPCTLEVP